MTASLIRRLTDLGTDAEVRTLATYFNAEDDPVALACTTTTEFVEHLGVEVIDLAREMSKLAAHVNRNTLFAIVSPAAVAALEAGDEEILRRIQERSPDFVKSPGHLASIEEMLLMPEDRGAPGPKVLLRLPHGKPLEQATVRDSHRKREPRRYTLSAQAIAKIDRLSKRHETSASAIVEAAVMAYD